MHAIASAASFIVPGCWIVFIGYWIISAFRQKPAAQRESFATMLAYRVPLIIAGMSLWSARFHAKANFLLTPQSELMEAIACALSLFGLWVMLWARRTLGSNWSSEVAFKKGHELVRNGPYRYVRHPIYTGLLLLCLGTAVAIGRVYAWLSLPFFVLGFWIKLTLEEAVMLQHFRNEYPAYRKQVKALVPFIL